ncbi:sorting nexin 2B-like [Impatiens glandulifera]|uniref:sorting nexin 2B-like n=1 Tax=Impatiens glandulifera TaxID=253017 RepID=UPI001FB14BDE|nr:sorting nexin 2B-like [Impatiens glandulifera]
MMGPENHHSLEEARLYASKEQMESLVIDDSLSDKSNVDFRSAMTTLSDSHSSHPLSSPIVTTPADRDPLISPPIPRDNKKPTFSGNSYIEPPSYADVVFGPLGTRDDDDGEQVNGVQSPRRDELEKSRDFSRSSSMRSDFLKITVSNPQKEVDSSNSIVPGGNTYITYLITTKTNLPEYGGSDFVVRRRFRDVVTLADRLSEGYRGLFVPPRPDKNVVESQVMQKQEFVEQRRIGLEKYLRRLASHPEIRKSDELRVFLQVQGKLPLLSSTDVASRMLDGAVKLPKQLFRDSAGVIAPEDAVQPAKGGRDLLRIFRELKQSVVIDWGGSRPAVEEEDKEFLAKKEKLHTLEHQLNDASKQAEVFVKAQEDLGETMGEMGLAFIKLTKFENEQAVFNTQRTRATQMKNLATVSIKASRLQRELNAQTVKHLDTLHEYLGLMLAAQNAFSDRSSALLTVQTLLSDLSSLQSRSVKLESAASKIFGGDRSRVQKIEEIKEAVRVTEDAKNCAIREYDRIKENNKTEITRFEKERKVDFVNMVKGFVVSQVAYNEKIGEEWSKVVQDTAVYAKESM